MDTTVVTALGQVLGVHFWLAAMQVVGKRRNHYFELKPWGTRAAQALGTH